MKKIIVSLFKDKKTGEYVADVTGEESEGKRSFQVYDASLYEKLESKSFEVDEDKDWNLAEHDITWRPTDGSETKFFEQDVKKCRDLILKDIKDFDWQSDWVKDIINKRFGNL